MARIEFDSDYAPCGFLIVKTGGDMYNDEDTVLIQSDWDFPGVASAIGFEENEDESVPRANTWPPARAPSAAAQT